MRIKKIDLKLLIENLMNEAVKDPGDQRWSAIRMMLNVIDQKKLPDFSDPKTWQPKDWDANDDALLKKVTGVDEIDGLDFMQVGKSLKAKLEAVVIDNETGKTGKDANLYGMLMNSLASESKPKEVIDQAKKASEKSAEQSDKKAGDVSGQEGKIIQDPKSAGYHYKKVGDNYYIISSPKDAKVSEKNASFVDPQAMKGAYDAISKLF